MAFWGGEDDWKELSRSGSRQVVLSDDGLVFETATGAETVGAFLEEKHIVLREHDAVAPERSAPLYGGMTVRIDRAKHVSGKMGAEAFDFWTTQRTVEDALHEHGISLGENDFSTPSRESVAYDGMDVSVVRVVVKEEVVDKPIPFEKIVKEDPELSWRKQQVEQKGEAGNRRLTYKVLIHNGKEVSRKLLGQETTKDPVTEITVQGTYVKVGKAHMGLGTWYAYTGTLAAASPWLPMGSYVKVTNQDNGKTVIVKINDRGPFGKNRILDLDKVAFAKIASLGAGVINLKVEEITN
jgi:uncharacterized protein YabE (DUF348 family)